MTNWQSPDVQLAEDLAIIKIIHVVAGIYIWEFVLKLPYDYSVITRKRKFVWTQLIYIGCRWSTLSVIITQLVGANAAQEINCQVWMIMAYIFGYLSTLSASSLIILRILALWERNRVITTIVSGIWLANAIIYVYSVATYGAQRVGFTCEEHHFLHVRISIFSTFITDLALLVLMFMGILRWKGARESSGIWWILYTQGLAWVVIFTLAEVPPVVLIILNLNYPMSRMFIAPGVTIMSIGASRIYLGLINSATVNNYPVGAVDLRKGATETPIRFPEYPPQTYLTDDTSRMNPSQKA